MAPPRKNPAAGILTFFRTADLAAATLVLDLATEAVRERQQRSQEAKARAAKPPKVKRASKKVGKRPGPPTVPVEAATAHDRSS